MQITSAERNRAHVRVGVGAGAAFVALLLVLIATRGPAAAAPGVPATAPTVEPQQSVPEPGFRPRRERRFGPGGGRSVPAAPDPGFGEPDPGVPDSAGPTT
jgi:hypothetical protein